ncbi:1-acyl-sn-glycerol-3-phosphate acyltransferase [Rhodocaloribacter litoris]|uniref:lysophospholipid acyltransferase family protein n=1 Tax=Rhodocaloribacter litoris TaxID=2558931 RepID=UPI0014220C5B|nr:lysophospholipid acyltransferase family protein [Rhodocaloribacter litoris]QXD15242.1 1-acyl-sn-glycerol-3-phosphate acyltransferase [Rhodocaloribacter litoris]GIV62236.1 MAG: hypothetical protein KatS3mg044_1102 [Rhodothermaceae bacterium]
MTWRTRLFALWALLWSAAMTVIFAVGFLVSNVFRRRAETFRWWARWWGRAILLGLGVRLRVEKRGRLDPDRPYVFAANHQNALDIPILAAALEHAFGFVAKAELEKVPFLGAAIKHSPSVFVDRSDPRRSLESIRRAGRRIRDGNSVLIFPEGERSYSGQMGRFKKGAFVLAVEAGVPLVPVTIRNGFTVLDERRRVARPGLVHVVVGEPIPLEDRTRRDIPGLMDELYARIARELPAAPAPTTLHLPSET